MRLGRSLKAGSEGAPTEGAARAADPLHFSR